MLRQPDLRLCLVFALAAASFAGCGGGDGPSYGLDRRVEVPPLPLPTGLPSPTPVQWEVAFPALEFDRPVDLVALPDGSNRLAVVEQQGRILVFANDPAASAASVFLDLRAVTQFGGEEGLLGLAFHPDYATNGWLYVYSTRGAPRRSVLSRFTVSASDPNAADPASEVELLAFAQPFGNHNGGALAFGPDGRLYVSSGDGGGANDPLDQAQSLTTLLGKILRLEPDGSVPVDNPYAGAGGGVRGEIWAHGLRNPWRMSFDPATGRLWVGDVGQGEQEEIDLIERAANYGWPVFEGTRPNRNPQALPPSAFRAPVHTYGRDAGASVTGGHVYRGSAVPSLRGAYVYADFVSGRVFALVHDGEQVVQDTLLATVPSPAAFGTDQAGELLVCCFDGRVRRLVPMPGGPVVTAMPAALSATGLFADLATLTPVAGVLEYELNAEFWSDGARKRRWLALPGTARIAVDEPWRFPVGTAVVKHFELEVQPGVWRRLETRVLLHQALGWQGYTYRWDDAGAEALLVDDGGASFVVDVQDADGVRQQAWQLPSRAACLVCHTAAAGRVLGLSTAQLNRSFDFPLRRDNQLRTWNHIGLFTPDLGDASALPALADPHDPTQPLGARARAWLEANCSGCHRPGAPVPVELDLRAATALPATGLVGVPAVVPVPGGSGVRLQPGQHAQSDLWLRVGRRDGFGMPPLGSTRVDARGLDLLRQWIDAGPP
ncbi:MAG: PQQ-dependent sugar dehydrogenase [Planctomycetes bacterium]|nr:PQQ-dependent sugar dehydrogenase [Planctomycetota bacterium]